LDAALVQLARDVLGGVAVATNTSTRAPAACLTRWRSNSVRRGASTAITRCTISGSDRACDAPRPAPRRAAGVGQRLHVRAERWRRTAGSAAAPAARPAPARARGKAQVQQAVGFVEHQRLDGVQAQRVALHQVQQAARRGHHDVGAAAQPIICGLTDTPPCSTATFSGCGARAQARNTSPTCAASSRVGTSTSTRTRRRALPAGRQALQQRQREGGRLAGAGGRQAQQVLAAQRMHDEHLAAGLGHRADEVAHELVALDAVDADAVLDGDRQRSPHRRIALTQSATSRPRPSGRHRRHRAAPARSGSRSSG
jgi:hypothetical protein